MSLAAGIAYVVAFWSAVAFLIAGSWLVRIIWGARASKIVAGVVLLPTILLGSVFLIGIAQTAFGGCTYDSSVACRGLAVGWPLALILSFLILVPNTFALLKKPAVQAKG